MGISWALKLLDQDERITGRPSLNAKAFLLLSDGQAWSGEVERALRIARERRIPVYVVGVGTSNGGFIPEPPSDDPEKASAPIYSRLDRESLATIAAAGGGRYMELDRERDTDIAVTVIDQVRKLARGGVEEGADDVYWAVPGGGGAVPAARHRLRARPRRAGADHDRRLRRPRRRAAPVAIPAPARRRPGNLSRPAAVYSYCQPMRIDGGSRFAMVID